MAEKGNTKQVILAAALDLFSTQGFEATSMQQIAEAVGIRKPSLYSHFAGKQEILDELVRTTIEQYEKRSLFAQADWDNPDFTAGKQDITEDDVLQMILKHFCYIVHDPKISRSRKMLTIEQFQNRFLSRIVVSAQNAYNRAVPEPQAQGASDQAELHGRHAVFYRSCEISCQPEKAFRKRRGNHGGPALPSGYRVDKPLRP